MSPDDAFDAFFRTALEECDADAWLAVWDDDPGVTFWGSGVDERAHGHDGLRAQLERINSEWPGLRFDWPERELHQHGDVAWINAAGTATLAGETVPYRATLLFVRRGDDWRCRLFNGSSPGA